MCINAMPSSIYPWLWDAFTYSVLVVLIELQVTLQMLIFLRCIHSFNFAHCIAVCVSCAIDCDEKASGGIISSDNGSHFVTTTKWSSVTTSSWHPLPMPLRSDSHSYKCLLSQISAAHFQKTSHTNMLIYSKVVETGVPWMASMHLVTFTRTNTWFVFTVSSTESNSKKPVATVCLQAKQANQFLDKGTCWLGIFSL